MRRRPLYLNDPALAGLPRAERDKAVAALRQIEAQAFRERCVHEVKHTLHVFDGAQHTKELGQQMVEAIRNALIRALEIEPHELYGDIYTSDIRKFGQLPSIYVWIKEPIDLRFTLEL